MSTTDATISQQGACPYCSTDYGLIYHSGGLCPKIKAIEYRPNGSIKRVEFFAPGDYLQPITPSTDWSNPVITWGWSSYAWTE